MSKLYFKKYDALLKGASLERVKIKEGRKRELSTFRHFKFKEETFNTTHLKYRDRDKIIEGE